MTLNERLNRLESTGSKRCAYCHSPIWTLLNWTLTGHCEVDSPRWYYAAGNAWSTWLPYWKGWRKAPDR